MYFVSVDRRCDSHRLACVTCSETIMRSNFRQDYHTINIDLRMSLTLSPLFSLDIQLQDHNINKDKEGFCGRWILKHKPLVSEAAAAGTTFPPFSHHLPYFSHRPDRPHSLSLDTRIAAKCKCLSEPDLNSEYQCESFDDEANDHDEDYLFEFDIGSPATSEEENTAEFEQNNVINVIEEDETGLKERRFSTVSNSDTNTSLASACSHRKESGVVADGFSSIFGSASSGVDSERRSQAETAEPCGGMSVEPRDWAENQSADHFLGKLPGGEGGAATPILAASPHQTSAECAPLVSPDSVISDTEFEECRGQQQDNSAIETDHSPESEAEKSKLRSDDIIERISSKLETPKIVEKVQINQNLVVSTEKLSNLLHKLESDKLYSNQDDTLEDEDLLVSPMQRTWSRESTEERPKLRKCSSLKTNKTPPTSPGRRKIVR